MDGYISELWDFTCISMTQNNLQELKEVWNQWDDETKQLFYYNYDTKKRVDVFALSIYGLNIFPKALGHIDEAVLDLFDWFDKRVTLVLAILVETFISLNACRRADEGRFIGCAQLLLAWYHSHFWKVEKVIYRLFSENYSSLKEFVATPRSRQFILATQGLTLCKFAYKGDNYKKKVHEISNAWNQTHRMKRFATNPIRIRLVVGVPVTIRPQQYQADTSAPVNYPTGSGSNLGDNLTNPVVLDLDDMVEMDRGKRWREVPTQVQPPLLEKEMIILFRNTLKAPLINRMLGSATKSFSDIVVSGEIIENAVRSGKIDARENTKRSVPRKKENEVNTVSVYNKGYSKPVTVGQPRIVTTSHQGLSWQESNSRPSTKKLQFTPIPMTYRELYQNLFDAHVVSSFYLKPMQPPFPKWYDANAQYEYHAGITGHSIDNCTVFKKLIKRFIKIGIVRFDDPSGSNVAGNSLPSHSD
ncbi:hypothetical protein EPI10_030853 [Gossypium australe]|uniref:DUF7745 domain-containing protein n=1 Tax=Gossypium australe TaxID=47621 RepID=A0A5B6WZZ8_9ROSI|nr:hypothetical protein EPI10_030853 [Gossypium australe]